MLVHIQANRSRFSWTSKRLVRICKAIQQMSCLETNNSIPRFLLSESSGLSWKVQKYEMPKGECNNIYPVGLQIAHHLRRQDVCLCVFGNTFAQQDEHFIVPEKRVRFITTSLYSSSSLSSHIRKNTYILIYEFKQIIKKRSEIWLAW